MASLLPNLSLSILTNIELDMARPNIVVVHAKQCDGSSRVVRAHLLNNGEEWTGAVGSGVYPIIRFRKSDRNGGFYDTDEYGRVAIGTNVNQNPAYVDLLLAMQVLTTPGVVFVELNFYSSDHRKLSSFDFKVLVEKSAITDDDIVSSEYFNALSAIATSASSSAEQAARFVGAPRAAASAAAMENNSYIYVYTGPSTSNLTTGHWYYKSGNDWLDGGLYAYDWSLVIVSDTIPSDEPGNRIWVKNSTTEIELATEDEVAEVRSDETGGLLAALNQFAGNTGVFSYSDENGFVFTPANSGE